MIMFAEINNLFETIDANKELLDALGTIIAVVGTLMALIIFGLFIRFLLEVPTQLRRTANALSKIADKEVEKEATIQLRRIANSLNELESHQEDQAN